MKNFLIIISLILIPSFTFAMEELSDFEMSDTHAGTELSNDINLSLLNVVPLFNMIDFNNRQLINNTILNSDGSVTFVLNDIERVTLKSSIGDIEILGIKLKGTEINIKKK